MYWNTFFLQLVSFIGIRLLTVFWLSVESWKVLIWAPCDLWSPAHCVGFQFSPIESVLQGHMGCISSRVTGCKELSRAAAAGSPWVTARVACSGSRLGSVRMAVVVLRRRSERRTTEWTKKWQTEVTDDNINGMTVILCGYFPVKIQVLHLNWGTSSTGLTRSEGRQRAVLVQPGQSGSTQVLYTGSGHHPIIGLKQRFDDDTELTLS